MRTVSPADSESGGLFTTRSDTVSPLRTSTSVPRLRPSVIGLSSILLSGPMVATSSPFSRKINALVGSRTTCGLLGNSKSLARKRPVAVALPGWRHEVRRGVCAHSG